METVSTLCATGSIIGAASAGYVFGQLPHSPAVKSSADSSRQSPRLPRNTITVSDRTSHSSFPPSAFTSGNSNSQSATSSYHFSFSSPKQSRRASPNPATESSGKETPLQHSKADLGNNSTPNSVQDSSEHLRHRSSRLKKFASFTFSSNSSPTSSLGFDANSLALSSESATPFIKPHSHSLPLPRNKLVKRSLSQHLIDRHGIDDTTSPRHTLARPATRHKRLETLSRNQPLVPGGIDNKTETTGHQKHKPFFQPKIPAEKPLSGLSKVHSNLTIRRMYPEEAPSKPLLLHTHSILPLHVEVEYNLERETEPFIFRSAPTTPSRNYHLAPSPPSLRAPPDSAPADSKPRRSFSIGDLLARTPSHRNEPPKKLRSPTERRPTPPSVAMQHPGQAETTRKRVRRSERLSPQAQPDEETQASQPTGATLAETSNENEQQDQTLQEPAVNSRTKVEATSSNRESSVSFASQLSLGRPVRRSVTPSDNASSQLGSDIDTKIFSSGDEDEGDKRSDSVYDSLRTGATRSSSGFRGPPLETLFDKEISRDAPSSRTGQKSPTGSPSRILVDEEVTNSTPSRTVIPDRRDSGPSPEANAPLTPTMPSSPPPIPKPLRLGALAWDSDLGDDESFWSSDEQEEDWDIEDRPQLDQSEVSGMRKSNLFDWSEPQQSRHSRPSENQLPRPKTVHRKKAPGGRSSRPAGRRTPSGLHARSQSVPVLVDLSSDHAQITSKFGTWGVGSKGVAEDWNDDFEFDDDSESRPESRGFGANSTLASTNAPMIVPDAIKEQQTNVLANIRLLKEWGILIEELKDMRDRANFLGLEGEKFRDLFDEVDAMIELADQEAEEKEARPQIVTRSSPAADFEGFERNASSPFVQEASNPSPSDADARSSSKRSTPIKSSPSTRSRKNSQAVAQSVIEALQSRRRVPNPLPVPSTPARKVPFDTTTLRHIVPHVNGLSKRLKQVLHDAEGLQASPKTPSQARDPSLSRAFIEPGGSESSGEGEGTNLAEDEKSTNELVREMKTTTLR